MSHTQLAKHYLPNKIPRINGLRSDFCLEPLDILAQILQFASLKKKNNQTDMTLHESR